MARARSQRRQRLREQGPAGNHLHALVCAGQLQLSTAQHAIAINWGRAYQRYIPLTVHHHRVSHPKPATPAKPVALGGGATAQCNDGTYRHPVKHRDDAITALHQLLAEDPTYRPPLSIRDQIRQEDEIRQQQSRTRQSAPNQDLAAIAESLLQKMTDLSMAQHHPEPDDQDLDDDDPGARDRGSMSGPDFDPAKTLPGNPHAEAASFVDDRLYPAAALREALLAIAFELRTADLIASDDRPDLDRRLGRSSPP